MGTIKKLVNRWRVNAKLNRSKCRQCGDLLTLDYPRAFCSAECEQFANEFQAY